MRGAIRSKPREANILCARVRPTVKTLIIVGTLQFIIEDMKKN